MILKRNGGQNHQRAAAPLYCSEKPFDGHISDGKGKAFPVGAVRFLRLNLASTYRGWLKNGKGRGQAR